MQTQLALAAAITLLPAAPASAAGFGELPARGVSPAAACVRATGAPGELVRWAPRGARVFQAGSAASTPVALGGDVSGCPSAAAQAGGAGVVAAMLSTGGLSVALRDPGRGWSAPSALVRRSSSIDDLSTAVTAGGDAAVAWAQASENGDGDRSLRVLAARRAAGGAFGAAVELAHFADEGGGFTHVRVGLDAGGGAAVLWTTPDGSAQAAFAAPGAGFGAPQPLATGVSGTPALALAPDGRALAALPGSPARLAEREPGAAAFSAPADLPGAADDTALALRAGGAAIVAWGSAGGQAQAEVRAAPGAFGAPQPLGPLAAGLGPGTVGVGIGTGGGQLSPLDSDGASLRAAFAGDGRPLITWAGTRTTAGVSWTGAFATTLAGPAQALGSPLRDAAAVAPVILAGGAPAVAWGDDDGAGHGRVHVAAEGVAATPRRAFPRVTVGPPVKRAIGRDDPLVVRVRCSAACDVRGRLANGTQSAFATLTRAGTTTLTLYSAKRIGPGTVKLDVLSGPPGSIDVRSQIASVRLSSKR